MREIAAKLPEMIPALTPQERDAAAAQMRDIAREAGVTLLAMHNTAIAAERKSDGSPVSEADHAAEAVIDGRLREAFPSVPIVSEENTESQAAALANRFFLVDPLDGTRAFLRGSPDFCVLIALIENGVPIAAAIDAPANHRRYWAGARAFVAGTDNGSAARELRPKPIERIETAIISAHNAGEASRRVCASYGISKVITENSALKFARLAEGEADLYPRAGRTMQWDVAAGDALLRALGGGVQSESGAMMRYGPSEHGWVVPGFIAFRQLP